MFLFSTKKQGKVTIFQILTFIKTQPSFEKARIEPPETWLAFSRSQSNCNIFNPPNEPCKVDI